MTCHICNKPVRLRGATVHMQCMKSRLAPAVPLINREETVKHLKWIYVYSQRPNFQLTLTDLEMIRNAALLLQAEKDS